MHRLMQPKQPWETFYVGIDFKKNLDAGETIDANKSTVTCVNADTEEDVTDSVFVGDAVVFNSTLMRVLTGGIEDVEYRIDVRAYISDTKQLEENITFTVKD